MRRFVVLAALLAACLAVFADVSSAKVIRKCVPNVRPGLEVVNQVNVIIYCGPAKATIHAGATAYQRSNGACYTAAVGSFIVGLGKFTTVGHKPVYPALLLVVSAQKDGTFRDGVLTLQSKGKALNASKVRVVVSGKRSRATFSGKLRSGQKFTGSLSCK